MPRTKVTDEQKKKSRQKATNKFLKEHMKVYTFRFHKDNQRDIIEHLDSQKNKAGYIADLIRKDLIAQGKTPYVKLTVQELAKQINDIDNVVLLFSDGSKLITDKASIVSDSRVVNCYERKELIDHIEWIIEVRYS